MRAEAAGKTQMKKPLHIQQQNREEYETQPKGTGQNEKGTH